MLSRILLRQTKNKFHGLSYRPRIEALEERTLLTTDTWTGLGGNVNWSNPANWDHGVPNAGDDLDFLSSFSAQGRILNDLAPGMTFHSITFDYGLPIWNGVIYVLPNNLPILSGNAIVLTGGIQVRSIAPGPLVANLDFSGL